MVMLVVGRLVLAGVSVVTVEVSEVFLVEFKITVVLLTSVCLLSPLSNVWLSILDEKLLILPSVKVLKVDMSLNVVDPPVAVLTNPLMSV